MLSATRIGYLAPSDDKTASTVTLGANVGHVFGRYGQGADTMPDAHKPFVWYEAAASHVSGMYISYFPEAYGDTGLGSGKVITMSVAARDYLTLSGDVLTVPTMPTIATDPDDKAAYLILGPATLLCLLWHSLF